MIDVALFARLTKDSAVSALIDTRVYPQVAPPKAVYPLVTHMLVDDGSRSARPVAGAATLFRTLNEVDIYARRRLEALELAAAVRAALDGKINEVWGGMAIKASMFDRQFDGSFDADPNLHRIIQQYRISFSQ